MQLGYPYDQVVEPSEVGMDGKRLEKVAKRFFTLQQQGTFPGGQLVVRRNGKRVMNLACGEARGWQGRGGEAKSVIESTPFAVYSCGKPMAAIVIAMLESQIGLDVEAPVASIIPEFAGMGRDDITLLDVLTHRGGIILKDLINNHTVWSDPEAVWQHLLKTPPCYPRGTFAYMPGEYGIILDRIVQEMTGTTIAQQFQQRIASELGLHHLHYGLGEKALDELAWAYWLGKESYQVAGMDVAKNFETINNDSAVFSACNPAFSMVADASSLAAFYEFLVNDGASSSGKQLLSSQLLNDYLHKQVSGWNRSVKTYLSMGRGFMLGTITPSFYDYWNSGSCFGHGGMFSSLAWGDHKTGLSVAIITNGNRSIGDFFKVMVSLNHGIRSAIR